MNIRQNKQWIIDIVENNKTASRYLERYRSAFDEDKMKAANELTAKVNIALSPYHLGTLSTGDVILLFG